MKKTKKKDMGKNMREKTKKGKTAGACFFIYKMRIEKTLAYRFDVFSNIIFQCIAMFANAFFWKAIYRGYDVVNGVAVQDMLSYTIVSAMMSVLLLTGVENRVAESVRQGSVATDMLKPIPLFSIYFFEDLGTVTTSAILNGLPILLVGCLFITIPVPASGVHFLLFLVSFLLSFFVNWLFAALFSLIAFIAMDMSPLIQVKKHVLRLLSGSIIPIWFFPGWLRGFLQCLPFVYIYQLPLDLYIGKITPMEALPRMGIQILWIGILFAAFLYFQGAVRKKVMVQGG